MMCACAQVDFDYVLGDECDECDVALLGPLPCFEIAGFGHHRYDPSLMGACRLLDWPPLWATVVVDELSCVAVTYLSETEHEAREDAQDIALRLLNDQQRRRQTIRPNELASFSQLLSHEYVMHGPLSDCGALALAPKPYAEQFLRSVEAFQRRVAIKLLTAMEHGLCSLPPSVRRRIYSYAATTRAQSETRAAPRPDMVQVQIHAVPGQPDQPWSGLHAHWTQSMPSDATINDAKRHVHAHLYEVNASMPEGQRLSDPEMEHLHIHWGWSWQSDDHQNMVEPPAYVLGAQPFRHLIDGFRLRGEEPSLWVFV